MPARNNRGGAMIRDGYSRYSVAPAAYACAVTSHSNRRNYAGGVLCRSAQTDHVLLSESRLEAGSNTSAIALRVIGGDEKATQCLGYNQATLFLGDVNTDTVKCGHDSRGIRT
jgi:hypothetical protein